MSSTKQSKPSILQEQSVNNLVAKHARTFNKAHVFIDRKKQDKSGGKRKHRGKGYE